MAIFCPFFWGIFLITIPMMVKSDMNDSDALLKIKQSLNNPQSLDSWKLGTNPCDEVTKWVGIVCSNDVVSSLRLRSMNLSGAVDLSAMAELQGLRIVDLVNNSFSGTILEFNKLGALKALYLSMNKFSGEIPQDYFIKMVSLKKLWFDQNNFTGQIPSSIGQLPNLIDLHLENNHFSGTIPSIEQKSLESLDLSNNDLTGEVPPGLSRFDAASFEGNPGLCGAKFGKICGNSTQIPEIPSKDKPSSESIKVASVLMGVAIFILALMIMAIILIMRKRKKKEESEIDKMMENANLDGPIGVSISSISKKPDISRQNSIESGRKSVGSSRKGQGSMKKNKGVSDLMVLNGEKGVFGLSDLMRASAEVLGNGALGSSYKATISNGMTVVVKRLKEMNRVDKDGFVAEMSRLGRLSHRNVLPPVACHYRKEEKLVVYEHIPNGSLLYLLHGDRGTSKGELNWSVRLKIIQGIAQGMSYIHNELVILDLPHGNLKSSNVLLGPDYEPLLMDYGLISMINSNQVSNVLAAFKAPETTHGQVTPKCDVYCLGIVILEILIGKFPSQYLNNGKGGTDVVQWVRSAILERREKELIDPGIVGSTKSLGEMQKLLHIGATCTESDPNKRLDIREAIKRIEKIQVEGSVEDNRIYQMLPSLRDGCTDAATSSPSSVSFLSRVHESMNENSGSGRRNRDSFSFHVA